MKQVNISQLYYFMSTIILFNDSLSYFNQIILDYFVFLFFWYFKTFYINDKVLWLGYEWNYFRSGKYVYKITINIIAHQEYVSTLTCYTLLSSFPPFCKHVLFLFCISWSSLIHSDQCHSDLVLQYLFISMITSLR